MTSKTNIVDTMLAVTRGELKQDFSLMLRAAISAVCNCYDHTQGLYPDNCSCDTRKEVHDTISKLVEQHRELELKYKL